MINILLQMQDTSIRMADSLVNQPTNPFASVGNEKISLLGLLIKGGVLMLPLALLLLIAIYAFFERYLAIIKASRIEANFMPMIRDHVTTGNVRAARSLAKNTNNPAARMIEKGILRIGKPKVGS